MIQRAEKDNMGSSFIGGFTGAERRVNVPHMVDVTIKAQMAGFRLHDCRCLTHRESLINRHATPPGLRSGKLQLVVLALNH